MKYITTLLLSLVCTLSAQTIVLSPHQPRSGELTTMATNGSAYYLNRANHTGFQLLATISDAGTLAALNSVSMAQMNSSAYSTGGNWTTDSGKLVQFQNNGEITATSTLTVVATTGTWKPSGQLQPDTILFQNVGGEFGRFYNLTLPAISGSRVVVLPSASGTLARVEDITPAQLTQSGATSGQSLVWNGSIWAPATIASGLTIGSTPIASGTDTYVLFNNNGYLGQLVTTGSGSVVRATSPTLSDVTVTGKIYAGNSNNYIWRSASTGNTEIVTATNAITMVTASGTAIMTATTAGLTLPGLVVDGSAYSYPVSYPTLPAWENLTRGRSYRPGVNVTAFAHQIIAPGDIYDGTGITITDAATLYIHGEPFAHPAGAAIAGNKWSLWIGRGNFRLDAELSLNGDTHITRESAAVLQLGQDVNGNAVDQVIKAADGITGTNRNGGDLTMASGNSTGTGTSAVTFKTPAAGSTGTTAHAAVERLRIDSTGVWIENTTAPASNPAAGSFILYVDPGDNTLRARGSSGTITILANP